MAAAVEYAMQGVLRGVKKSFPTLEGRRAYLDRYLTARHRDTPGTGCPMAALSGEIRNEPEVKGRFAANLKEIISAMGGERREGDGDTSNPSRSDFRLPGRSMTRRSHERYCGRCKRN